MGLETAPSPRSYRSLGEAQTRQTTKILRPWVDPRVRLTVNQKGCRASPGLPCTSLNPGPRWPQAFATLLLALGATRGPACPGSIFTNWICRAPAVGQREVLPSPPQQVHIVCRGECVRGEMHARLVMWLQCHSVPIPGEMLTYYS